MGWKGAVRSIGAASRSIERGRQQRERQRLREYKGHSKRVELADSADAVARYEEYIEALTSVHRETTNDYVDWRSMAEEVADPAPPRPPRKSSQHENAALEALAAYSPGVLDRMLKRTAKRQESLELAVAEAAQRDEKAQKEAMDAHRRKLAEYDQALADAAVERALATRVLSGDVKALEDVIKRLKPFSDMGDFGSSVSLEVVAPDGSTAGVDSVQVTATIRVFGKTVLPSEGRSLLKSGKLSVKKLSASQFNEIHQDYVCGCVLRIANELLTILPVRGVIVSATDEMLNSATGHIEDAPVLSLYAPRDTMERLNLRSVDPSDALSGFIHRMSFKKTTGFSHVKAIVWDEVPARPASSSN